MQQKCRVEESDFWNADGRFVSSFTVSLTPVYWDAVGRGPGQLCLSNCVAMATILIGIISRGR